jgi:hypothetical protein
MKAMIRPSALTGMFAIEIDGIVTGSLHFSMQEAFQELLALNYKGLIPVLATIVFK